MCTAPHPNGPGKGDYVAHARLTFTRIHSPHHSGVTVPCFTASSCMACTL